MSGVVGRETEKNQEATVYVGNLDERVTEELLYELMIQVGPVVSVNLPQDKVNQLHQGFGFVEFRNQSDSDYATLIMNQIRLYNKPIRVNKASIDKQKTLDVGADLFVGNLDPLVDEKTLYETFSTFGALISYPRVVRNENGESRMFAFLQFDSFESSDRALESMNGQLLMNRPLTISYAFKKDGKSQRHGDEAERLLAEQAKKNNYSIPVQAAIPPPPPPLLVESTQNPATAPSRPTQLPVSSSPMNAPYLSSAPTLAPNLPSTPVGFPLPAGFQPGLASSAPLAYPLSHTLPTRPPLHTPIKPPGFQ